MLEGQYTLDGSFDQGSDSPLSATLNLDKVAEGYRGTLYVFHTEFPNSALQMSLSAAPDRNAAYAFTVDDILFVDTGLGAAISDLDIIERYRKEVLRPGLTRGFLYLVGDEKMLGMDFEVPTDFLPNLRFNCISGTSTDSGLESKAIGWGDFQKQVSSLASHGWAFRGQTRPWRLATTFHRMGRYDMRRYANEDIPLLHQRLSSLTKHYYRLDEADQYAAFLMLLQHHGFPTPLLDWTYSPYVAAYFAIKGVVENQSLSHDGHHVRLYCLNVEEWRKRWMQYPNIYSPRLHITCITAPSIENTRVVPQQAFCTFSTVADMEQHLVVGEKGQQGSMIQAFDIPFSECRDALRDLSQMGITSGSMFPGLDGVCEEMKLKRFYVPSFYK